MRYGLVLLIIAALHALPNAALADPNSTETRVQLASVCKHFVNRARFMARGEDQEFVVTLADACVDAQRSLDSGEGREQQAAADFLTLLKTLRDTVIDMNMTRVFGDNFTPFTRIGYGAKGKTEAVRRVSQSGEYLIAHRMGVLRAYRAWLDTDPRLALLSKQGPQP